MKRIGIVCALYFEASCFMPGKPPARQPVRLNESTSLIVSGIGRDRAKQAAQQLIGENVDYLVSFGTAGALAPTLRPGDLLLPQTIIAANTADLTGATGSGPGRQPYRQLRTARTGNTTAIPAKHPHPYRRAGVRGRAGHKQRRQTAAVWADRGNRSGYGKRRRT